MPLRPAKFSDHASIAEVCGAAFFEEDLFGRMIHPRRNEFPEDFHLFFLQWIRREWCNWRNQIIVAVTQDSQGQEKIVGVAIWQRQGEGGKKMALGVWDPRNLAIPLTKLSNHLNATLYPNRALDPSKAALLQDALPFSAHHWAGLRAENWYLNLCCVHPDYQGKGFGKPLVQWGLKLAEHENVHASVLASEGNDGFYLKCGFDEVVGNCTEGKGNPLGGIKGGNILFWFPKGGGEVAIEKLDE